MMINLFSIFDPSTSIYLSLNWFRSLYVIIIIPNIYWFIPSRWNYLNNFIFNYLLNEFKLLLNKNFNLLNIIILIRIFYFVLINNFIGIFPYIFTSSSHLIFRLTISLSIWLAFILFGWIKNTNHIFIHLVPIGTPGLLIFFIVIIESIRNFIRPGTLGVRLSANIIAGHLLITLISSTGNSLRLILLILMVLIQSLLIILELRVSVIQAYVITILRTLYSIECKN